MNFIVEHSSMNNEPIELVPDIFESGLAIKVLDDELNNRGFEAVRELPKSIVENLTDEKHKRAYRAIHGGLAQDECFYVVIYSSNQRLDSVTGFLGDPFC